MTQADAIDSELLQMLLVNHVYTFLNAFIVNATVAILKIEK